MRNRIWSLIGKSLECLFFEYENDDVPQYANQEDDNLDLLWMMCHALKVPETPMWVGFNSQIVKDPLPKQGLM